VRYEERRHRYRESRVIEVWCEEPFHEPVLLGSLKSEPIVASEWWTIEGPHVELQRLSLDKGLRTSLPYWTGSPNGIACAARDAVSTLSPGTGSAPVLACGTCGKTLTLLVEVMTDLMP
jgi:hypothetical protein